MPLRRWLRRGLLALGLLIAALPPAGAEAVTFDIPAARAFARQAALSGRPDLARQVALALLARDPGDVEALIALAAAEVQLHQPKLARQAAARAFQLATTRAQRYLAARMAAKAAFDQQRLSLSQYWLRRAVQVAPDPASYADTVAGFRQVSAQNPWHNTLDFSLSPSSNVNQGSSSDRLIIDGVPTILTFSGDAQALSGLQFGLELGTSRKVRTTPLSQTEAGLRLIWNRVALSGSAQSQAPAARGADYAYAAAEASVTHSSLLRPGGGPAVLTLLAGRNWYGGDPLSTYARIEASKLMPLAAGQSLRAQLLVERQWHETGTRPTNTVLALEARYDRVLAAGDRIGLRLGVVDQQSDDPNAENLAFTGEITYALARPVGPAQVSFGLSATARDYPVFFSNLFNQTGRQDQRLALTIGLTFPKAQVWGFAPQVNLTGSQTRSNISRFEGGSFSVGIGLRSVF